VGIILGRRGRIALEEAKNTEAEWLQPPAEHQGLTRYLETIRERWVLIIAAVVATTLGALIYVATADEVYEAEADILVAPLPDEAGSFAGLGLLIESGDPLRLVETAATLIKGDPVARQTAEELGTDRDPESILRSITVEPVAESNILTVTAEAGSAEEAADLANAFANSAVTYRTDLLHQRIDDALPVLEQRLDTLPAGPARDALEGQIGLLDQLRAGDDPTLEVVDEASPPGSPSSPRVLASIVAGALAGLILGIGGAFALRVLDPRLQRETQIRTRYRLPILARIPKERSQGEQPLDWMHLSPGSVEAYRTLRAILARPLARSSDSGSIMVTSAGPSEGKTTTAINLATSLALAGKRVILIEADLRRPSIAEAFEVTAERGVISVLIEETTLVESLVPAPASYGNLGLLVAEMSGSWGSELLGLRTGQRLVEQAKEIADYVVVDSPPLATVVDALPLARTVDDMLLVARLGVTRLDRLQELCELLADTDIVPTGFTLVGVPRSRRADYYGQRPRIATGDTDDLTARAAAVR
jgi:capsular exopolysaccharide synthesis family protein